MTDFNEQWDRMTVVERIAHIRAVWAKSRETDDPLVLRIASAVAHDVCRQAADEIERLSTEVERLKAEQKFLDDCDEQSRQAAREMREEGWRTRTQIRRAIFQLAILAGGEDPDELNAQIRLLHKQRDDARRNFCCQALPSDYKEWKPAEVDAMLKSIADEQGWDCFK